MSIADDMREPLLARRVPREEVVLGRAYVIHARHGGVGVALMDNGCLGYELHRVKFGASYLFERLAWLAERDEECREEIDAAWVEAGQEVAE